jgi:hypothetical protein
VLEDALDGQLLVGTDLHRGVGDRDLQSAGATLGPCESRDDEKNQRESCPAVSHVAFSKSFLGYKILNLASIRSKLGRSAFYPRRQPESKFYFRQGRLPKGNEGTREKHTETNHLGQAQAGTFSKAGASYSFLNADFKQRLTS